MKNPTFTFPNRRRLLFNCLLGGLVWVAVLMPMFAHCQTDLAASRQTTLGGTISFYSSDINPTPRTTTIVENPNPEMFCDTMARIALFVVDTTTGESKTRRVWVERTGTLETCQGECSMPGCMAYHISTCKDVKQSRYWYYLDGSQVFIEPRRILETYDLKK